MAADTEVRPQAFARLAGHAVARRHRHRQARRQDGRERLAGAPPGRRPAGGRRRGRARHGPRRPARAGAGPGGDGLGAAELLAASRAGRHAASDCYEDAVLAGVTDGRLPALRRRPRRRAVRRQRARGAAAARGRGAALAVIEGSGAVVPPVAADATLCVAGAAQPADYVAGFLGTYRLLLSDVLVLTQCEPPFADDGEVRALTRPRARQARPRGRADGVPAAAGAARPRPPRRLLHHGARGRRAAARAGARRRPRRRGRARLLRPRRPAAAARAGRARRRRGRRVPHRDQGGGGGRGRRGRRRRRPRARLLRQRARRARGRPRRDGRPARRRSRRSASPSAQRTAPARPRDEGA